jgi:long-chain acyl-CoA synthetase
MTLLYNWLKTAAVARGNNKALVYRDNYLSWRGLLHRVDRRAQEFRAMGIKQGAWVGLMLGNVPDFVILALALSKLKGTVVPIDPTTGARELELIMAAAPLRALVTRPRGSEATGSMPPPPPPEEDGELTEIRRRLQGTLLTCSVFKNPLDPPTRGAEAILITSDSLGDPKGVVRTADNMEKTARAVVQALSISADSRILTAVPLYHAYGWDLGLLPTLASGATMFLEEEISSRRVAKLLRDHNIDVLPGTPTMYGELATLPTAKPLSVDHPRFISGGAPLDPQVSDAMLAKYGVHLMSLYHSTETGIIALDTEGKTPKSVGKPVTGVTVKITEQNGTEVKGAKKGLVWVKSDALSPESIGPFKEAEPKRKKGSAVAVGETDGHGWYRTGDIAKIDKSGRILLVGREDDVVKVDGKRVALGEVEGCLEAFPKVKAAEARLVSEPFSNPMVVARVVAAAQCEPEEIIDHCARNLAPYKVPRRIEFCDRL